MKVSISNVKAFDFLPFFFNQLALQKWQVCASELQLYRHFCQASQPKLHP